MIRRALLPLLPLTVVSALAACAPEGETGKDNGGGATTATGGATTGVGGAGTGATVGAGGTGSGGIVGAGGTGSGGIVGAGGAGTGGGSQAAFTCPAGITGTPDLTGKTVGEVATAPSIGGDAQVFLEGPVWVNGALYVSHIRKWGDQPPANILKLNGTTLEEFIPDAGSNGLALRADGKIVAADHKAFGLVAFDPNAPSAAPVPVVTEYMGKGFNSPNDLTIRADGNIYFTDPAYQCGQNCPQGNQNGQKRVYRVDPTGVVSTIASAQGDPNGIALSPDGNTLYVAGSSNMEKFTVAADGSVGAASPFAQVSSVDGLGVDCAGNVYATVHPQNKVDVYKPDGTLHGSISVPSSVTNVAFGGADNKTLYITTYGDGKLYSVTLDIPGYPY